MKYTFLPRVIRRFIYRHDTLDFWIRYPERVFRYREWRVKELKRMVNKRAVSRYHQNRKEKGIAPRLSRKKKFLTYRKFNHKCNQCGKRKKLSVDHIIPISMGGTHNLENLQLLCLKCHGEKDNIKRQ